MYYSQRTLKIAVTFLPPLCSQVEGFGPVASDSLLSQVALPVLVDQALLKVSGPLRGLHPRAHALASTSFGEKGINL